MSDSPHELRVDDHRGMVVVRVVGEVDQSNATTVEKALREHAKTGPIVFDLSSAEYLDSAGIAMLDTLRHVTDLRLVVAPGSIISRAFGVTGLDQLIPTFSKVDDIDC